MKGKLGITDTAGNIVIPFKYEHVNGWWTNDKEQEVLFMVKKNGRYGVLAPRGKTVIPVTQPRPPEYIGPGALGVRRLVKGHWYLSLISRSGQQLLPPLYDEIRSYPDSAQGITSLLIERSNAKSYLVHKIQQLDGRTYQPVGKARIVRTSLSPDFSQANLCGYGANMARRLEALRPKYHKKGHWGEFNDFSKDGTTWTVCGYVAISDDYPVLTDTAYFAVTTYGYAGTNARYTAVVDYHNNFIIPPQKEWHICGGNMGNNELLVQHGAGYALADTQLQLLTAPVPGRILTVLHHKGRRYCLVPDTAAARTSGLRTELLSDMRGLAALPFTGYENRPASCLLTDDSGHYVPALSGYRIAYACDSSGVPAIGSAGLLLTTDSLGMQGILTPEGQTVFPGASFRYPEIVPVHYSFVDAAATLCVRDKDGYVGIISHEGERRFPGISFRHGTAPAIWEDSFVYTGNKILDIHGRELLSAAGQVSLYPAVSHDYRPDPPFANTLIPGLYMCRYGTANQIIYIDRHARIYGTID